MIGRPMFDVVRIAIGGVVWTRLFAKSVVDACLEVVTDWSVPNFDESDRSVVERSLAIKPAANAWRCGPDRCRRDDRYWCPCERAPHDQSGEDGATSRTQYGRTDAQIFPTPVIFGTTESYDASTGIATIRIDPADVPRVEAAIANGTRQGISVAYTGPVIDIEQPTCNICEGEGVEHNRRLTDSIFVDAPCRACGGSGVGAPMEWTVNGYRPIGADA